MGCRHICSELNVNPLPLSLPGDTSPPTLTLQHLPGTGTRLIARAEARAPLIRLSFCAW